MADLTFTGSTASDNARGDKMTCYCQSNLRMKMKKSIFRLCEIRRRIEVKSKCALVGKKLKTYLFSGMSVLKKRHEAGTLLFK